MDDTQPLYRVCPYSGTHRGLPPRRTADAVASHPLIVANREKCGLMRDGVQVAFTNDDGERMRVFDFGGYENNHFLFDRASMY